MMQVTVAAVVFVAVLGIGLGHICLINPHQRGSMKGINKPGAADCDITLPPCGGRAKENATVTFKRNHTFLITVQKNVNHFNKANPGKFVISIGRDEENGQEMGSAPDTNAPALTLYNINTSIPAMSGNMVLQAKYISNKPNVPIFYQCADIMTMH